MPFGNAPATGRTYTVMHLAVEDGETIVLGPDDRVVAADFDHPMHYLTVLVAEDESAT